MMGDDLESPIETSRRFKPDGASPTPAHAGTPGGTFGRSIARAKLAEKGEFYVLRELDQHVCTGPPRLLFILQPRSRGCSVEGAKPRMGNGTDRFRRWEPHLKLRKRRLKDTPNGSVWTGADLPGACLRGKTVYSPSEKCPHAVSQVQT